MTNLEIANYLEEQLNGELEHPSITISETYQNGFKGKCYGNI